MDKIRDIIPDVIEKISSKKPEQQIQLQGLWDKLVGESGQRHAAIHGLRDGVVTVHVDSSIWLFQMNMKKRTFLTELQKNMPDIKQIVFKVGRI